MDSGLGMDILKIVLGRQLGEKSGANGNTNTKGKEGANVGSEREEDDAMEGDGGDEMKSSKVVVKGLGRVIEAAWFNLHHGGIWRSFSSIKLPLGCEKRCL